MCGIEQRTNHAGRPPSQCKRGDFVPRVEQRTAQRTIRLEVSGVHSSGDFLFRTARKPKHLVMGVAWSPLREQFDDEESIRTRFILRSLGHQHVLTTTSSLL